MASKLIPYVGFCDGTYKTFSPVGDVQFTMNLYPETNKSPNSKSKTMLYRVPGKQLLFTLPTGPVQAMYELNGRAWIVAGNWVYEVFSNYTFNQIGQINSPVASSYITMGLNNNNQLFIVSQPSAWVLNVTTNVLQQVTSASFNGAQTFCFLDGYFVVSNPNGPNFQTSASEDGLTWSGLNAQQVSDFPDNIVAVENYMHYLVIFGFNTSVVFYDTGSNSTIFARYEGTYAYAGLVGSWAKCKLNNTIYYLSRNENGVGTLCYLDGFTSKAIQDYSFQQEIQQYSTISDAIFYGYQEFGHMFVVMNFPTAGKTWVYDVGEQKFHNRGLYNPTTASYQIDRGRFFMSAFGVNMVGDYSNGNVYRQSMTVATDNSASIRWVRRAPHLYEQQVRMFYPAFIVAMNFGNANQGQVPELFLKWSDDGGMTWGNEVTAYTGQVGQYRARIEFDQCGGGTRDRVFELAGTDSIPVLCITDVFLYIEPGTS